MKIKFDVLSNIFTKRNEIQLSSFKSLTPEFRYRVQQLCVHVIPQNNRGYYDSFEPFWLEMYRSLNLLEGKPISDYEYGLNDLEVVNNYLQSCNDGRFIDFIELVFQAEDESWNSYSRKELIDSINQFLQMDDLPYHITEYIYREYSCDLDATAGTEHDEYGDKYGIIGYPKVIRRENEVIHASAIQPALMLLSNPIFTSANSEFMEAHGHYRKGEYGDCLTKCSSSMESVMKIICDQKGWNYSQEDNFNKLLDIIFQQTNLDSFLKQPIMQIGTLRNRLGTSHGAGVQSKSISKHKAQFTINISASSIILLASECGLVT